MQRSQDGSQEVCAVRERSEPSRTTRTATVLPSSREESTSLTHPNGARIDYTYLTNNWLGSITHKRGGGVTFDTLIYAYDANGNRTTLTDGTGTTAFGYDALNRLTSAAYPGEYGTWSWTYDAVGNRLIQNSPSGQTTYGYDANNRLTQAGSTTYSYDNNGNLISISSGATFTYDAHNRLTLSDQPKGLDVQYTYNGDGLKIRRIEGATTTRYYHDGFQPIYEAGADGSRNADLERDIFGNLLARQDAAGSRYYYHHDGLGSTVGLTDASGQVAAQRTYDAWGNRRTSSGSAPGNYQFTGAELDPTSGLYHMGARFYDPAIGRWLSEDPAQDKHFEPATLNFYVYVKNNPGNSIDPTGLVEGETTGGPNPPTAEEVLQAIITAQTMLEDWLDNLRARGIPTIRIGGNILSLVELQQAFQSLIRLARRLLPAGGIDAFLQNAFRDQLRVAALGFGLLLFGVALTLAGLGVIGMPIGQHGAYIAAVGVGNVIALLIVDIFGGGRGYSWKFW